VVGWTDPEGSRSPVGALLLGYYTKDGRLLYAGRAGTGRSGSPFLEPSHPLPPNLLFGVVPMPCSLMPSGYGLGALRLSMPHEVA
jgi:hypothetical protein